MKDSWNYTELPKGIYSAGVSGEGDRWMFRAYPNRGDICTEGIYSSKEDACAAGASWIKGEKTDLTARIYSASF